LPTSSATRSAPRLVDRDPDRRPFALPSVGEEAGQHVDRLALRPAVDEGTKITL
jgi:hypothetical protein